MHLDPGRHQVPRPCKQDSKIILYNFVSGLWIFTFQIYSLALASIMLLIIMMSYSGVTCSARLTGTGTEKDWLQPWLICWDWSLKTVCASMFLTMPPLLFVEVLNFPRSKLISSISRYLEILSDMFILVVKYSSLTKLGFKSSLPRMSNLSEPSKASISFNLFPRIEEFCRKNCLISRKSQEPGWPRP